MKAPRIQRAVPGILGGLGPLAHIELERALLDESVRRGARGDADHPVWVVVNASDIPDRTASLAGRAPSCTPHLARHAGRLAAAGADFIVVPCNTAHAFYDQVSALLRVPWLHMIDETALAISRRYPHARRVGVLATDGTLASGVYTRSLAAHGLTAVTPAPGSPAQQAVMQAIYDPAWGIKATGARLDPRVHHVLAGAHRALCDRGADVIVAACTELSVAIATVADPTGRVAAARAGTTSISDAIPWIDPLRVVASRVLDLAFADPARPRAVLLAPNVSTQETTP